MTYPSLTRSRSSRNSAGRWQVAARYLLFAAFAFAALWVLARFASPAGRPRPPQAAKGQLTREALWSLSTIFIGGGIAPIILLTGTGPQLKSCLPCLRLAPGLPDYADITARIRAQSKPTVAACMARADQAGQVLVQPRVGVGGQREMQALLRGIESRAAPDVLTLTIDSYTRLGYFERAREVLETDPTQLNGYPLPAHRAPPAAPAVLTLTIDSYTRLGYFERAREVLETDPTQLNGYPLVAHGWASGSRIDAMLAAPLQVRHGSPDGRRLFAETVAAGLTSFEGGPIGYNIPYCKFVPLEASLAAWREIDELAGILATDGIVVEREMFGSLSGVLVPPSVALSCVLVEALMACAAGCRSISLSVSQCGWIVQDVALLRAARQLCQRYLPAHVAAHVVLHQFMGIFPREREQAEAIIFVGGVAAARGGATKVITKTSTRKPSANPTRALTSRGCASRKRPSRIPSVFRLKAIPGLRKNNRRSNPKCARSSIPCCRRAISPRPCSPLSPAAGWTCLFRPASRRAARSCPCATAAGPCASRVRAACPSRPGSRSPPPAGAMPTTTTAASRTKSSRACSIFPSAVPKLPDPRRTDEDR